MESHFSFRSTVLATGVTLLCGESAAVQHVAEDLVVIQLLLKASARGREVHQDEHSTIFFDEMSQHDRNPLPIRQALLPTWEIEKPNLKDAADNYAIAVLDGK